MERKSDLRERTVCEHVFTSSIMLLMGLTFCFILMVLVYFTYQTLVGNIHHCSLWIDIPGRMAIFLTCYYVACLCGYFPIPRCYQPRWFPEPFILWKFESWKNLFKSLCIPTPSIDLVRRLHMNAQHRRESNTLPLYHEESQSLSGHERFANRVARRRSSPVYINPEEDVTPEGRFPIAAGKYDSTTEYEDAEDSFQSFDSPEYGGFIPLVKEPPRPRYQSDTTNNRPTTSQMKELEQDATTSQMKKLEQDAATSQMKDLEVGATTSQIKELEQDATRQEQKESEDKPLNFPRFPWYYFRHPGGVPPVANKIHQKNLQLEKREYKKKLKIEKQKTLKKIETSGKVICDDRDNAEKQSAAPEAMKETKPSEDSKVSEKREHLIGNDNLDPIRDQSTSTKDEAEDGRQEASDQKIGSEKKPKTITVPYSNTGTRRRLRISQKHPPQSIVRLHHQKKGVKYIDDLQASRLEIQKSKSTHRKTYSEVGAPGMSEECSTQTKLEKEGKSPNVQAEFDRIRMMQDAYREKNTETSSTSESAQNIVAGTQTQSAAIPMASSQKSEETDAGDLNTSTSGKSEHDDKK